MKIGHRRGLIIKETGVKGRGVFTTSPIGAGQTVEVAPVIVLTEEERAHVEKTRLYDYIFAWGDNHNLGAVALGFMSLYNHASPSNCEYVMDYEAQVIILRAMRNIGAGEELTINYSSDWDDEKPVWFEAV